MTHANSSPLKKLYSQQRSLMKTSTQERLSGQEKSYLTNSIRQSQLLCQQSSSIHHSSQQNIPKNKITSFSVFRYQKQNSAIIQPKIKNNVGNLLQDYKRKTKRNSLISSLHNQSNLSIFLKTVQQQQQTFDQYCREEKYLQALEIIINLLNYSVDLNLPLLFSKGLKIMAQIYLLMEKISQAFFYFNETRQSSILLTQQSILIQSLIGMSKCASKTGLEKQAIIFLKKALEYSWLYNLQQYELLVYDQIGKRYYHIGDLEKAKRYHLRYINAICQNSKSALKMLSKQRVLKRQELNIEMRYDNLDKLFLVHLKIPIRQRKMLAPLIELQNCVRDEVFLISQKYHKKYQEIELQIKKILKNWFFKDEIEEPELPSEDWTTPLKQKKFAFIDFKLNQTLKRYANNGKKDSIFKNYEQNDEFQFKLSLEQKIAKRLKQPCLNESWYQSMISQIKRDRKNKLLNVRNSVRIRGYNKACKPALEKMKSLYNDFFIDIHI